MRCGTIPAVPPKLYNRLNHVQVLGPEYQRALHTPRPEIGWQGDPDLTLAYHHLTGWEVIREEAVFDDHTRTWVTRHIVIARQRAGAGARFDINELLKGLVARDVQVREQSHKKAAEDYIKSVEKEERERERAMFEAIAPVHEKLAWTTAKETGDLAPQVSLAGLSLPAKDAVDS